MDFFHAQDLARRRTWKLVGLFTAAVLALIVLTNVLVAVLVALSSAQAYDADFGRIIARTPREHWWWISVMVLLLVGGAGLYKYLSLRGGGSAIAEALGGRRLAPGTNDFAEKRAQNVVEEVALAAGVPVPPVYLVPDPAINAFAAGIGTDDAVIGITQGALEAFTRDELQGVIGHEFSHILNGDMHLNVRLVAMLHGILFIGLIGYSLLRGARFNRRGSNVMPVMLMGAGLVVIGFGGTFFGNLIKAAVSRQREYLADAAAVQFTRNPGGIAGALKKIGASMAGSTLSVPRANEFSHMFFGAAVQPFMAGLMATHPPLPQRIRAIEPDWDGSWPPRTVAPAPLAAETMMGLSGASGTAGAVAEMADGASSATADTAISEYGRLDDAGIAAARSLLNGIPSVLIDAAHEGFGACALVYALLLGNAEDVRRRQLAQLGGDPHAGLGDVVRRLHASAQALDAAQRLALVSLAMPALKGISARQYSRLIEHALALIRADRRISLFEWVLHRLLVKELKPAFEVVGSPRVRQRNVEAVAPQANELISALARSSRAEPQRAHAAGMAVLALDGGYVGDEDRDFQRLSAALGTLRELHPLGKPRLLKACAATVLADDHVGSDQWTLLQGISATLDCPLPPHLPPVPDR
jgi:Zn-dependent protease with chaperone function